MRCRIGDTVLVIRGLAAGAVGTIIDTSEVGYGSDWLVLFPRPVPGYGYFGIDEDTRCHAPDDFLRPLRPDPEQVDTTEDLEVAA